MTTQPNDGGPAFPSEQGHTPDGLWNQSYCQGMSLRDWFAGTVPPLPEATSDAYAESLLGAPPPSSHDRLDHARYWARADAVYRYMCADAMIAARGQA